MSETRLSVEGFCVGPLQANCYLVWDPKCHQGVVVDPGMQSEPVLSEARSRDVSITAVVCTHGHFDHVHALAFFRDSLGCPVRIHAEDGPLLEGMAEQAAHFGFPATAAPPPDIPIRDGERLPVGGCALQVLHTPGHTPGSVCLLGPGFVLTGDTLFAQSVGRTDLPGGSYERLMASIREKLLTLPDVTVVHPGHGPSTSILHERRNNPFLKGLVP